MPDTTHALLSERPAGKVAGVPVIAQVATPVVVGVCVAAMPSVSTTVAGVKAIVGFAIRTEIFRTVDALSKPARAVTV